MKLRFMSEALQQPWPVADTGILDNDVQECLNWMASRSPQQIMAERETVMRDIENRAAVLRNNGAVDAWFKNSDDHVRRVSADVSGPLLAELASACQYHGQECVDFCRAGAPLYGTLPLSGNGAAGDPAPSTPIEEL